MKKFFPLILLFTSFTANAALTTNILLQKPERLSNDTWLANILIYAVDEQLQTSSQVAQLLCTGFTKPETFGLFAHITSDVPLSLEQVGLLWNTPEITESLTKLSVKNTSINGQKIIFQPYISLTKTDSVKSSITLHELGFIKTAEAEFNFDDDQITIKTLTKDITIPSTHSFKMTPTSFSGKAKLFIDSRDLTLNKVLRIILHQNVHSQFPAPYVQHMIQDIVSPLCSGTFSWSHQLFNKKLPDFTIENLDTIL